MLDQLSKQLKLAQEKQQAIVLVRVLGVIVKSGVWPRQRSCQIVPLLVHHP